MSKGTDVEIHIAKEETPNTLPAVPEWHTLCRNSDSLKKTVSLTQSDEIVDSRFEQGSVATSAEAVGNIEYELSALSQDMFFEGVAGNMFVGSGTPSVGNAYGFNFTKLELDNDGLSDTNKNDDHTMAMEFRHVKEAPTITRTTA